MRVNGERLYPVDRQTAAWLASEYQAKLETNSEAGSKEFASGRPRLFRGYNAEDLRRTYGLTMVYDPGSQHEFIDRISGPLLDLSTRYGIPAIASGVGEKPDLKPHTTVQVGRISPGLPKNQVYQIMSWMDSSYSHIRPIADILKGLQFRHNQLVIAPIAYTCEGAPDVGQGVILRVRRLILKAMTDSLRYISPQVEPENFTEPYRYDNIFHASVWRIIPADRSREPVSTEALIAFAQEANRTIGASLKEEPMLLRVREVFTGDAYGFIRGDAPHLINPST